MPDRTTDMTVTFRHPFTLSDVEGIQPAGTYRLTIEEAEVGGISFLAYQRTTTILHVPALEMSGRMQESYTVRAEELENAIEADRGR